MKPPKIETSESNEVKQNNAEAAPASDTENKKFLSRQKILILIAVFILAAACAFALLRNNSKTTQTDLNAAPQQNANTSTDLSQAPASLIYAYDEFKDKLPAAVRQYNPSDKSKKQIFEYKPDNPYLAESEFYKENLANALDVALSPDSKNFAYSKHDGLFTRQLDGSSPEQLIKLSVIKEPPTICEHKTATPKFKTATRFCSLSVAGWSSDSKYLAFYHDIGVGEGGAANALNLQSKSYVNPTNTFRYIDETPLNAKFTVDNGNRGLLSAGVLPDYLFKEQKLNSASYSTDKKYVYAVLCPKDLPNSGDSHYIVDQYSSSNPNVLDCGEPADKSLIKVRTINGKYEVLAHGKYDTKLLLGADELIYIIGLSNDNHKLTIYNIEKETTAKKNLLSAAGVTKANVVTISLNSPENPTAAIYHKKEGKYYATVVDLSTMKAINTFNIDKYSSFKVLSYK